MQGTETWLALAGAVFGGAGLKIVESWLNRSKVRDDAATQLREELRKEVTELRNELRRVEDELDKWKSKYYELLDQFYMVKQELATALAAPTDEVVDKPAEPVVESKPHKNKH